MTLRTHRFEGARGSLELSTPASWVLVGKVSGHYGEDLMSHYLKAMNDSLVGGASLEVFHDWEAVESYDSTVRKTMTDWVLQHRQPGIRHHILMKSKLVKMGVATANLVIGGDYLHSFEQRAPFDEALRAAIRTRPAK